VNIQETAGILAMISALDGRKAFGEIDAQAWTAVLGDVMFDDAREAVIEHYRESTHPLMPADVLARVKEIRRKRIGNKVAPLPPIEPSNIDGYAEWQKAWYRAIGDGMTESEATVHADNTMGIARVAIDHKHRNFEIEDLVRKPE
jgi:hypothetical protein